ncbi:MAG: hypothetical protein WB780_04745, partial [Candidatus Acidiferrales bacterium]
TVQGPDFAARVSTFLKISIGIIATVALALGPRAAFAQHGGGGGGSHGGGGGHSSGGSHGGGHSGGSRGTASRGPASGSGLLRGPAGGSRAESAGRGAGGQRFIGNNTWQDPPNSRGVFAGHMVNGMFRPGVNFGREGTRLGSRDFRVGPRFFMRHRFRRNNGFFGDGCFNGFFPGFCNSGFLWGPAWGNGLDCDPDWGCSGYGYLNSDVSGGDYDSNVDYDSRAMGDAGLQENAPFLLRGGFGDDLGEGTIAPEEHSRKSARISKPTVTIYLKDGSSYGVTDYWLADGNLHYVTNYGGENSIPAEQLDLQRTVDENAGRGVNFTLYNEPSRSH